MKKMLNLKLYHTMRPCAIDARLTVKNIIVIKFLKQEWEE